MRPDGFYPSHLTKGLLASGVSVISAIYAVYQFSHTNREEVQALLTGK